VSGGDGGCLPLTTTGLLLGQVEGRRAKTEDITMIFLIRGNASAARRIVSVPWIAGST